LSWGEKIPKSEMTGLFPDEGGGKLLCEKKKNLPPSLTQRERDTRLLGNTREKTQFGDRIT